MINTPMVKLEIFIPCSHLDVLREALQSVGAGLMGNYDSAMSYSVVTGCWRPLPGANPYDGEIGVLTEAKEYKVEVCCKHENLEDAIKAVKAVHPYETPVINAIPLITVSEDIRDKQEGSK
jgi:hypothetical protein